MCERDSPHIFKNGLALPMLDAPSLSKDLLVFLPFFIYRFSPAILF